MRYALARKRYVSRMFQQDSTTAIYGFWRSVQTECKSSKSRLRVASGAQETGRDMVCPYGPAIGHGEVKD